MSWRKTFIISRLYCIYFTSTCLNNFQVYDCSFLNICINIKGPSLSLLGELRVKRPGFECAKNMDGWEYIKDTQESHSHSIFSTLMMERNKKLLQGKKICDLTEKGPPCWLIRHDDLVKNTFFAITCLALSFTWYATGKKGVLLDEKGRVLQGMQ